MKLYTKGDAYDVVKSNGEDRVFESFRYVASKGKDASQAHILVVQNRAMNPEGAKTLKDIERRMAEWKKDLRYLDGVKANTIVTEQNKHIMIGMMPDTIADQMTINYKKEETYEVIEQNMVDLVDRMLQREKKSTKKNIGNVTQEPQESNCTFEENHTWDYSANNGYGGYFFSAMKRQRTDDGETGEATKKKGPVDACFTCGGDHYASSCPQNAEGDGKAKGKAAKGKDGKGSKGKGKGKGKQMPYMPYTQWEYIRPNSWPTVGPTANQWRTMGQQMYSKGGKGSKGNKGGKGPAFGLNNQQAFVPANVPQLPQLLGSIGQPSI